MKGIDMELLELIDQYKECSDCMKTSNYPSEWLEDIVARKKAVFEQYQIKEERLLRVNAIHDEYSKRFDAEIGEVKIPYNGQLLTLAEAEALLEPVEEEEQTLDSATFIEARKGIIEYQRYLDSTDWYVIRQTETGEPIPQEVLQARSEARTEIDKYRALGV